MEFHTCRHEKPKSIPANVSPFGTYLRLVILLYSVWYTVYYRLKLFPYPTGVQVKLGTSIQIVQVGSALKTLSSTVCHVSCVLYNLDSLG